MGFPFLLRPDQEKALSQLEKNHHLILVAPTGSGKSLVFQKYIFDRPETRALFISPLNALSRQMEFRFKQLSIPVYFKKFPHRNQPGVWIMSPESLKKSTEKFILEWQPDFLIVDEAHCIWEWGKNFRPSYSSIIELPSRFSISKSIWCSATFPMAFQRDLQSSLSIRGIEKVAQTGDFSFPDQLTLKKEKISPEKRLIWLKNKIHHSPWECGMIFCNTRSAAERIQSHLRFWGVRAYFYHAGLSHEEKLAFEKMLIAQEKNSLPLVVVATSAFGMGMDYPFFEFCILFEPPFSLLGLVQAVGRIGRSRYSHQGAQKKAYVLWHEQDFLPHQSWMDQKEVMDWCSSLENPMRAIENYFNGSSRSGTMKENEKPGNHSLGSSSAY